MQTIFKYPRTQHIRGSRLQQGDEDLADIPLSALVGQYLVIEEKVDGANCGVSFDEDGRLLLQSRGHYLTGGPREKQFDLLKTWVNVHAVAFWSVLGSRYVMYGEWMYAKHTVYYNHLPHYFMEFDVLDREEGIFLDTARRMEMMAELPMVASVRVIYAGALGGKAKLDDFIGPSAFIHGDHLEGLRQVAVGKGLRAEQVFAETDPRITMEGLYIKSEADGKVVGRYKYIRASFLQALMGSESHWMDRPMIPNGLAPGVDIFAPSLAVI